MAYQLINYEKKEKVARITLNVPPLNWMTISMMREINDALVDVGKDQTVKVLIFDHAGEKAFSSGVDVADHTEDKVEEMIKTFHHMFRLMYEIDIPIVGLVNGVSLGGGCELTSFCDIVLASDRSRLGQPEIAVGVFPPVAAAWFSKIVGLKKTYELLFTGRMIGAQEAKEIGLVNTVFPAATFREDADKFLAEILNKSRPILIWSKRAIRTSLGVNFPDSLRSAEVLYLDGCMKAEDAKEGIAAFMGKRKAVWKDK